MLTGRGNRGFSLVEVMIALVITVLIFGVAAATVTTGQNSLGGSSLQGEMQDRARALMNRLENELINSGPSSPNWDATPADPIKVRFRKCMGYDPDTAEVLWDPPEGQAVKEIRLEDDPDDRNPGDWKRIVIREKGHDEVIQSGLPIDELSFVVDPDDDRKLTITLKMARLDLRVHEEGSPTRREIERKQVIFLRN